MKKIFVIFAVIAFCACGCHTAKKTPVEKSTSDVTNQNSKSKSKAKSEQTIYFSTQSLTDTKWVLTHINGEPVMDSPEKPYIIFTGDRVTGCMGCNTFFGTFYATKKGRLDIDYAGATKRLCNDMLVEKQFMSALKAEKKSYQIKYNVLIISGEQRSEDGIVKKVPLLEFHVEE